MIREMLLCIEVVNLDKGVCVPSVGGMPWWGIWIRVYVCRVWEGCLSGEVG